MGKYTKEWWAKAKQLQTELINENELLQMLSRCKDEVERICLILLYYTGARPEEILQLRVKNVELEPNVIKIGIPTVKRRGVGRTIFIPRNNITEELANYVKERPSELRLVFKWLHSWNIRDFVYRVSEKKYTAYFFRHNRLTQLAQEGVDAFTLKYFKGAKSLDSVADYVQMSGSAVRKLARKIK